MFQKLLIIFCLFSGISLNVFAESVYVSDNLRVGVRPEPDNGYAPVGVVTTGMKLDVLERKEGYLKVRTDTDLVGWIKDIYVI